MSNIEANGSKCLDPTVLIHSSINEQTACLYNNKKRTVQHPSEGESSSHTPKRNRMEITDPDVTMDQYSTNLHKNQQETAKTSSSTTASSYFNTYHQMKKNCNGSSIRSRYESSRQSFPPFRIILEDPNKYPTTELIVIKEINKYCKLNLTYGRYAKTANNQMCYLLYTSTTAQFEYLMCQSNWPNKICNGEYKVDLPSKIPSSYSIVAQNVPSQWSAEAFGNELKQYYPSIVRAVRLFIKGGRPLSKVRIDFSSYKELSSILKSKRILLDDENTAYTVEPYLPPTRVLRCYICQAYDDHIAAHCPNKNDPICFRCAQHHPYNPNCENSIQCVHSAGDHMAGNPSCPVKSDKRQEKNQRMKLSNDPTTSLNQQPRQAWSTNTKEHLFCNKTPTTTNASAAYLNNDYSNNNNQIDMNNTLNKIHDTMLHIKQQQDELNERFNTFDMKLNHYNNEISSIKCCINEILCPLLKEISSQIYLKAKGLNKQTISPLYNKLTDFILKNSSPTNVENVSGEKPKSHERSISNSDPNQTMYES
ncbi:unnamed protein product [Rotaria magnacalcarata]|uniref:Uncharacterized protein n=1 Tax=Rotaria magnacalcarata TaxID=392030 RepID=A0A818YPK0_9BILA|nr:unnamed protein product [Rotaria magnacalcarata]CAF2126065.1 unnamed protein product [Rotaria magnacalcarata]CAF3752847.1 unnamed protein product [Rotaria magnacalcarata]CAF4163148.1 unnamed protein product [Rotaria magnacalcarata]